MRSTYLSLIGTDRRTRVNLTRVTVSAKVKQAARVRSRATAMTTVTPTTQAVDETFAAVGMLGGLLDAESVQFRVRLVQLINWGGMAGIT